MHNSQNIIEAKNLVFKYEEGTEKLPERIPPAVNGVSINIKRGSFTAIIGHNGSGKSTLAKLLSGVFLPNEGSVKIYPKDCNKELDSKKEEDNFDIRKTVGMVFQNPDNQIVATIVEEDVAFGPENLGIEPSEIRRRVDESLKIVGMYKYKNHEPHKLSGGQKQRVAIAGIIAMEPRCIILDEPTAMLDPEGRRDVMKAIKRLNKELGITVVFITHYMEEACEADRIVVMDDSHLLLDGTPKEVFADTEKIRSIGLDVPQTCVLAKMLKEDGINLKNDLLSIDELVESIDDLLKGQ